MSEAKAAAAGKKSISNEKAIAVLIAGGILMAAAILIPTEQGTTAHLVKVAVGIFGIIVLFVGAYLRPAKQPKAKS